MPAQINQTANKAQLMLAGEYISRFIPGIDYYLHHNPVEFSVPIGQNVFIIFL